MTKISLMIVFIDLVEVLSFGRLHQRYPMDDMPGDCRFRWDPVTRNHFLFLSVWFQRERCEASQSVVIMRHVIGPMAKSVAAKGMKLEI
jgi:hypothetical protein